MLEFKLTDWIGKWDNFSNYIESEDRYLVCTWEEADEAGKKMGGAFAMGVKKFWGMACDTALGGYPEKITGWNITIPDSGEKESIHVEWIGKSDEVLFEGTYRVDEIVANGLEKKECFLFKTSAESPFKYLLAMKPMPEREARLSGGLISHLHFQFAASKEVLVNGDSLVNNRWYPTMCDGEADLLEKCNIVRALHRMPKLDKLPE